MSVKWDLRELAALVLATLLILFYPVILLVIIVCKIYRRVVQQIVSRDPNSSRVLNGMDACMAGNNVYTRPISIISPFHVYNSRIDKDEVVRIFREKLMNGSENNKCLYPEMTQKIVRKYGYNFWFKDENFSLENHIKYHNEDTPNEPMTRRDINDLIAEKVTTTPFHPERSPWEILIVRNVSDPQVPNGKSALIFKFHHCLIDGYSMANFFQKIGNRPWNGFNATPKSPKLTTFLKIRISILLLIFGPYQLIKYLLFTNDNPPSIPGPGSRGDLAGRMNTHETKLIHLSTLKRIKDHFKVSMTSVLFTIMAEGLREFLDGKKASLKRFHVCTLAYIPGHPDRLSNNWSAAKVPVTLNGNDIEQTLRGVDAEYNKLQRSLSALAFWNFSKFIGLLPVTFHPDPTSVSTSILLVSNFPGPPHDIDMFGYEMEQFGMGSKPCPGYQYFMLLQSQKGCIRILCGADVNILPEKRDVAQLANILEDIVDRWAMEVEAQNRLKLKS